MSQNLPRWNVLTDHDVNGQIVTLKMALPDRGAGYSQDDLRRWFKEDLHKLLLNNQGLVKGKTVRLYGANVVQGFTFAGFALAKAGAHKIEGSTPNTDTTGEWLLIASHDDPEAPIPLAYEPGMIIKARIFGAVSEAKIIAKGLDRNERTARYNVSKGGQTAWISEDDINEFVRYARPGERF